MSNTIKTLNQNMHASFWDKTQSAIEAGEYFEAIFRIYAALESRLESISDTLDCPCNKKLSDKERSSVKISQRLKCIKSIYNKNHPLCRTTRIDKNIFTKTKAWIDKRNRYMHGLYKKSDLYEQRIAESKALAEEGLEIITTFYREATRIKRYKNSHPDCSKEFKQPLCKEKKPCFIKASENHCENCAGNKCPFVNKE